MDLQSIFYLVSITFMLMLIALLITFVYILAKIQQSVRSMKENIQVKTQELISGGSSEIMGIVGTLVSSYIASRVRNIFRKKRSDSK